MQLTVGQLRRIIHEAIVCEDEIAEPCEPEAVDDGDVEEMSTVANVGIFGYPTPGPFAFLNMPFVKRVKRRRRIWNGRVG